jgi:hypothetical protein
VKVAVIIDEPIPATVAVSTLIESTEVCEEI